jgi:hypothetical protein
LLIDNIVFATVCLLSLEASEEQALKEKRKNSMPRRISMAMKDRKQPSDRQQRQKGSGLEIYWQNNHAHYWAPTDLSDMFFFLSIVYCCHYWAPTDSLLLLDVIMM